jgi:glutathione synthase/RimK-type ligase-like ATP-grasp enzyme
MTSRYDIALLYDPGDKTKPSNDRAIENLIKAGNSQRVGIDIISKDDYGRLAEYDALFIRTTTGVNHYTFRFARRAVAEGLVVIDHPDSILRCTNKVYLAELMKKHSIPTPRTLIVHRKNRSSVLSTLGLPCIIKQPDSSSSMGVVKVEDDQQLYEILERFLSKSEMVIGQEYMPTDFDWRIGMLDNQPLFACKYFMAHRHWQIARRDRTGRVYYGNTEATVLEDVPPKILRTAINAANLIGDGLYGVDLKEIDGKCYLIEINENPNIDAGDEDTVGGNAIYDTIIASFIRRIEARKVLK